MQFGEQRGIAALLNRLDHCAIKTRDTRDYEERVDSFLPLSTEASYLAMDDRRMATFILRDSLSFGTLGQTRTLEVLEPRPGAGRMLIPGFEHVEFLYGNLDDLSARFIRDSIVHEQRSNPGHSFVTVPIGDKYEIKFTDKPLDYVVRRQQFFGESRMLKRDPAVKLHDFSLDRVA